MVVATVFSNSAFVSGTLLINKTYLFLRPEPLAAEGSIDPLDDSLFHLPYQWTMANVYRELIADAALFLRSFFGRPEYKERLIVRVA